MRGNVYIYIAVMALVSYAIRALPITVFKKPIQSQFIQSFLYYVPYATLAVMVFPAIIFATNSIVSGIAALVVGVVVSWRSGNLFKVAVACCITAFIIELFI